MFMACERYCALAMPFRYRRCFTMQKTLLTSLSLTIFAVLVSCLPILGLGSYELSGFEDNNTYCKLFWKPDEPPLYTLQFTIYFSASMILTTVVVGCNIGLTLELFRMRRKIADLTQGQHVAKGHEIKFVWTVMVITLAFLSCWLPWVFGLAICKLGLTSSSELVVFSSRMLVLNHAMDPFIFLVSRYARKGHRLLTGRKPDISSRTTVGLSTMNTHQNEGKDFIHTSKTKKQQETVLTHQSRQDG
ncbi:prostaglandin F2-alpha receptor-like [Apostichopus japonicus]|uniref:prostaglandin F2-alpha receptor-like n=1 Tax=Stichopus japonicus TaxID=307972 RepID=UPI003AB1E1D0